MDMQTVGGGTNMTDAYTCSVHSMKAAALNSEWARTHTYCELWDAYRLHCMTFNNIISLFYVIQNRNSKYLNIYNIYILLFICICIKYFMKYENMSPGVLKVEFKNLYYFSSWTKLDFYKLRFHIYCVICDYQYQIIEANNHYPNIT